MKTTKERIDEIRFKVDHRKLHPQEVYESVSFLLGEIERLNKLAPLSERRPL